MKYVSLTDEEAGLVNMLLLNMASMVGPDEPPDQQDLKRRIETIARKVVSAPTMSTEGTAYATTASIRVTSNT